MKEKKEFISKTYIQYYQKFIINIYNFHKKVLTYYNYKVTI